MTDIARFNNDSINKRNLPKFYYNKDPFPIDFADQISKSQKFEPKKKMEKGLDTCIKSVI